MTGEDHYREAERLLAGRLAEGDSVTPEGWRTPPTAEETALAQVHATLAQAAATWHTTEIGGMKLYGGWPG